MKAQILKSTESTKGGFVNTIAVSGIKKCPVLGDMTVNDRYYFKSPTQVEIKEVEGFNLSNYNITTFKSDVVDEITGEVKTITSKWLTPAN
jgi:hypothetical protein